MNSALRHDVPQPDDGAAARLARTDRFIAQHAPASPCVIIDLETVRQRYGALRASLPGARIY